jgi:hypothetical protein
MMKNFMTSGSLTKDRKLMEDPGGSDTRPFSAEDVIMMVYVGRPPSGRHRMSNLSPRTSAAVGDTGSQGCKGTNFPISLYIYICEYVYYYRCFLHWQETGGQDHALQFQGGHANYRAHYDLSWFRPLLGGNSPTSSGLILKMNRVYNGVSREL